MKRFLLLLSFMLFSTIVFSQYTRLTNIPTIYIETFNNEPITSKNDYIYANMVYVGDEGEVHYDSLEIRGRGNTPETASVKFVTWSYLTFVHSLVYIDKLSLALAHELITHKERWSKISYTNLFTHLT